MPVALCVRSSPRRLSAAQFPKLRTLDLSWNMLETIHGLDSLKLLKELKLYRNKLTTTEGLKE